MFYSGIDQHKLDSVITTYNAAGERLRQRRLRNDRATIVRYFAEFPGPHRAVVETTGRWYWLRDLLVTHGIDLQLAHAKRLKAIRTATVKTDAIDSDTLAQLCPADVIPLAHMIRPEFRGARDLLRTCLRLVRKRTSCRNSIHRLLEKFNVPTIADVPAIYQLQAACDLEQSELLLAHIRRLEQEPNPAILRLPDVQRLLWIPGVGKLGACTIALEVDNIARFLSDRKFASYGRLVPGAANSGGKTRHRSGSKDGNRYLQIAFTHAATRAIQDDPEIQAGYTRLARRKNGRVARTLVAKALARIVFPVLRTQTDDNGTFKGKPLRRMKRSQWPRLASPDASLIRPPRAVGSRA